MAKGIAKLHASVELIEDVLFLPDGIRIKNVTLLPPNYDTLEFIITGDGLPTIDETNGELIQARMTTYSSNVIHITKSVLSVDGKEIIKEFD